MKILIVEDNKLNMKFFVDLLEGLKYEVIQVFDSRIAISIIEKEKPNLILMDIQMEGLTGKDLIKSIRENSSIKDTSVIAVTAFAKKNEEEEILNCGFNDILIKPIFV